MVLLVYAVRLVRSAMSRSGARTARTTVDDMSGGDELTGQGEDQRAGDQLRQLLQRATLTPEQFAHRLNRLATQMGLTARIDRKTPYKWLRGGLPREPW